MSKCAYCGQDAKPTREHIIPAFIYNYQKLNGGHEGWNEKAGKVLANEAKIKDTCAKCNSEALGSLDGDAKTTLDELGVFTENFLNASALLKCDYDSFTRWLLKVTFNSARATGNTPDIFKLLVPYMLGQDKTPDNVFILGAIHKPAKLTTKEMKEHKGVLPYDKCGYSNPFFVRISIIPKFDNDLSVRSFIIGSFIFLVVIFNKGLKIGFKRAKIRKILKQYNGLVQIKSEQKVTKIEQITLTFLDTQKDQFHKLKKLDII
jgi:hypothetical protein